MKREWICLALLLGMLALSLWNIAVLDSLIGALEEELAVSEACAGAGDFAEAEKALDRAIARWESADPYTHIFIRHAEIDSASDAFFELKGLLAEKNAEGLPSAFDKIRYHLDSIDGMEHIRPGSVL